MAEKREPSLNFRVTPTEERQFRDAADALDILAAGQAVTACGAGRAQAPALKQEPAYGAAR